LHPNFPQVNNHQPHKSHLPDQEQPEKAIFGRTAHEVSRQLDKKTITYEELNDLYSEEFNNPNLSMVDKLKRALS
jgi:hypothetical protein